MSALPRIPPELGYTGLRMSADEYLALGETQDRYELIDGVVFMSPSPFRPHQRAAGNVLFQLQLYQRSHPDAEVLGDTDVRFSDLTVYRPDVVAYRSSSVLKDALRLDVPPDLVVEVLSGGTQAMDLLTKRDDYERFGVKEYWVIDPLTGRVRCWRRQGDEFIQFPVGEDSLESAALSGFVLDLVSLTRACRIA